MKAEKSDKVFPPENKPTVTISWGKGTKYPNTAEYVWMGGNRVAVHEHDIKGESLGWRLLNRRESAEHIDQLLPVLKFAEWAHETAKDDEKVAAGA